MSSILVIDDKDSMRQMLSKTLESEGYEVETAKDGEGGLKKAKEKRYDLVLADLKLPKMDGLEVLSSLKELDPEVGIIMMTAYGTIESAVEAMKQGAFDFLTKPFDTDYLNVLIKRALENRRLVAENILLREELTHKLGYAEIIGKCEKMKEVSRLIQKVAPSDTTVLLLGESGTGKELFARAIHSLSLRKKAPYVAITFRVRERCIHWCNCPQNGEVRDRRGRDRLSGRSWGFGYRPPG
jgi:DNA-binding NtrC family response regulator